ncbi:MAG: hypothetical protein ACYDBH_00615 [Acidobacteriaceae bacterium]
MRHVVPTVEVPHLWAHASQPDARNPQGNLYFRGDTIFSYRDSWPLARIYSNKRKGTLVLTNSETASITTSQHQAAVNRAVCHLPTIAVPFVLREQPGGNNIAALLRRAGECLLKAQRGRSPWLVTNGREEAQLAYKQAAQYQAFFGIRRKLPAFPASDWDAAAARMERLANPDPLSLDKRARATVKRRARALATLREKFESSLQQIAAYQAFGDPAVWRAGGELPRKGYPYVAYSLQCRFRSAGLILPPIKPFAYDTLLRVRGDQIETSLGARIPLSFAPIIWRAVQKVLASGIAWRPNGHTLHAGTYAVDEISADGTLHVGCHTIRYSELELMARQLGYIGA